MQEYFLHFESSCPCLLSINGETVGSIDNKYNFTIDIIAKTPNIFATFCPISDKSNTLSYTFAIDNRSIPTTDSKYVNIIPFTDNHFDIIMEPFIYYPIINSTILLNQVIGKYYISITSTTNTTISIFSGASMVYNKSIDKLSNAKAEIVSDIIVIKGIIDDESYYLLVVDSENFKALIDTKCESIESTNDYIECYTPLHTIVHHAMVCKVDFKTKKSEIFYVYENNSKSQIYDNKLLPLALLECVKYHDEEYIQSITAENISSSSIEKFSSYFGEIKKIYYNKHYEKHDCINYTVQSDTYRNYNFYINQNKIIEIEENT